MNKFKHLEPCEAVDKILREAVSLQASDIYWIPQSDFYSIRCRINGIPEVICELPLEIGQQCTARLKVMSQLLTYRSQVSQDGVIHDEKLYPDLEFRIAVMPTIHGERITIRICDKKSAPLYLDELNFTPQVVSSLRNMLFKSSGMIVLTGPTGCGKTTTIYAMIRDLIKNDQDPASIISIEDPVECRIPGISQVSLSKSSEEWNYAKALRAALRQDIKTLIIGEMRDHEVMKVALDASLTGHRVITTFHAGDISSVYARILHQGFEPFLVASAIGGILSQRLLPGHEGKKRIPLAATLVPDDSWKDFIITRPSLSELRKRIQQIPDANLQTVAENMAANNLIDKKDVFLI